MAVTGARTTKGLYFTFTLLCLVCLASSLVDEDQLEKLKDKLQGEQHKLDSLKAEYESKLDTSLGHMNEVMNSMDQVAALVKKIDLPDEFSPVEGLLQNTKSFMEKTETYVERKKEEFGAEIGKMKEFLEFLEKKRAEL